jgi:hypothetical protein
MRHDCPNPMSLCGDRTLRQSKALANDRKTVIASATGQAAHIARILSAVAANARTAKATVSRPDANGDMSIATTTDELGITGSDWVAMAGKSAGSRIVSELVGTALLLANLQEAAAKAGETDFHGYRHVSFGLKIVPSNRGVTTLFHGSLIDDLAECFSADNSQAYWPPGSDPCCPWKPASCAPRQGRAKRGKPRWSPVRRSPVRRGRDAQV